MATSWLADPNATFEDVEAGKYTDLQYVAYLDVVAPTPARASSSSSVHGVRRASVLESRIAPIAPARTRVGRTDATSSRITREQVAAVRRYLAMNKSAIRQRGTRPTATPKGLEFKAPQVRR
jgi:hypothetical protein